jgi:hypothetical protein
MNAGRSGMTGDCHVSICEGLGVKFPRATQLCNLIKFVIFYDISNRLIFALLPK